MKIANETREILERCSIDGNKLYLPPEQLDRKLYLQVNKALEAMGGKWDRKSKCHIFDESVDVEDVFNQVIETGEAIAVFKKIQFFETPDSIIDIMLEHAQIEPGMLVLEPSAGKGAIAKKLMDAGAAVDACEIHKPFCKILSQLNIVLREGNFLGYMAIPSYQRIVANPPFAKQQDIDHVSHMVDCLLDGGILVSVLAAGFTFRKNSKVTNLKTKLDRKCQWQTHCLPEGAFKQSGTNVNAILLVAHMKGY